MFNRMVSTAALYAIRKMYMANTSSRTSKRPIYFFILLVTSALSIACSSPFQTAKINRGSLPTYCSGPKAANMMAIDNDQVALMYNPAFANPACKASPEKYGT